MLTFLSTGSSARYRPWPPPLLPRHGGDTGLVQCRVPVGRAGMPGSTTAPVSPDTLSRPSARHVVARDQVEQDRIDLVHLLLRVVRVDQVVLELLRAVEFVVLDTLKTFRLPGRDELARQAVVD